jgi:tetratricopeptide (TPR) repeat protein
MVVCVGENLKSLFLLYAKPVDAIGRILDRGRVWFAALVALGVSLLLHARDIPLRLPPSAMLRFISWTPGSYLAALLVVAAVVVPAVILVRAVAGFGSFAILFNANYLPLLMCALVSWAAAYLPLALVRTFTDWPVYDPLIYLAFNLYFTVLLALSVRSVFGTGFGVALGMTALAWAAGVGGAALMALLGGMLSFLASPLVLIYLFMLFGSRLRSFGDGLRSRQHFQQQLEISTNNPHDGDAHYQLGLIYQKRRQYTDAISRFEQAIAIDPSAADAHLQLGVIAREQKRFDDAIRHLQTAATIDDKLAQSDVWRELGAAYLGASRLEEAAAALKKYTERRAYDPEGLYWYGMALKQKGLSSEAKEMFDRCTEAVHTMPSHRRAQVREWSTRAKRAE